MLPSNIKIFIRISVTNAKSYKNAINLHLDCLNRFKDKLNYVATIDLHANTSAFYN